MNNSSQRIDFSSKVGLPIWWEEDFLKTDDRFVVVAHWYEKYVEDLKGFYLNAVSVFPKIIYKTFWLAEQEEKSIFSRIGIRVKFVALYQHIVGVEFPKTKTVISSRAPRVIENIKGDLRVLLHPSKLVSLVDIPPVLVKVKEGEKLVIPPDWAYTVINTSNDLAFFVEVHPVTQRPHKLLRGTKGGPFYLILRNNNLEIVKNPHYKIVSKYVTVKVADYIKELSISPKTPVIKQFLRKYEKFTWFFNPDSLDWSSFISRVVVSKSSKS